MEATSEEYYSTPTWKWVPNIIVSVWGRGKATMFDKEKCPLPDKPKAEHGAEYRGDCDNCKHFRGCDFKGHEGPVLWGERLSACCGYGFDDTVAK